MKLAIGARASLEFRLFLSLCHRKNEKKIFRITTKEVTRIRYPIAVSRREKNEYDEDKSMCSKANRNYCITGIILFGGT